MTESIEPTAWVYVDEQGDRGFGLNSSKYFSVTAVIVPAESYHHMRAVIGGLRHVIGTPGALHWVNHFPRKQQGRRALAAELCAGIPGLVVVYALAHKQSLVASQAMKGDNILFYHYVTKLALERAAFALHNWSGGGRKARVVLASIRGTSAAETKDYYRRFAAGGNTQSPVGWLADEAIIRPAETIEGLQLADIYQGMFGTAVYGEPTDKACGDLLLRTKHQVRRDGWGNVVTWGLKPYPPTLIKELRAHQWWLAWGENR